MSLQTKIAHFYGEDVGNTNNKTQTQDKKRKALHRRYRKSRKFIIKVKKYNKRKEIMY